MVGARAGDAMRALANQYIHTRLIGPVDGTVVRQSPPAGQPTSKNGVTLVAK
jgi:beta-lactam-binding protein with PASTA domain